MTTRVVCTCRWKCGAKSYQNDEGDLLPGQLVAPSTRTRHRRRDLASAQTSEAAEELVEGSGLQAISLNDIPVEEEIKDSSVSVARLRKLIQSSVSGLGAWLHLVGGVSRSTVNRTLKAVGIIVDLAFRLGRLSSIPIQSSSSFSTSLPQDVRTTITGMNLDPKLVRTICCPRCFKQYPLSHIPQQCDYRAAVRSRKCGEELWTTRMTRGGPRVVPKRLYTIQDFESWLEYFLSCPGVEEWINKSYSHQPNTDEMRSIWDSPAWRSLGSFTTTPGNLTFTYFIDWFNPFTNKIAGKTVSAGAIMLFCLNLPPHLQHRPEYTFFAGITPPPKEPTMETITAVSDPVIQQIERMWAGKMIRTRQHPSGCFKRVGILPAIGDLLAIRKALGFAGIASNIHFCSFCTLHKDDIEELDCRAFKPRVGMSVRAVAEEWRVATTKKKREELFRQHGVRWSSLHRLLYRDPIQHTILGLMHNWIEGILQHHARCRWGIGAETGTSISKQSPILHEEDDVVLDNVSMISADSDSLSDVEMLDDELEALHEEHLAAQTQPVHLPPTDLPPTTNHLPLWNFDFSSDNSLSDNDSDFINSDDEDDDHEDEPKVGVKTFTPEQLAAIRLCISEVVIPSWVERPPSNLGEKSHGKLKADQWLKLFTVFLPLILPELWTSTSDSIFQGLLENFHSLVTSTNLVCAYTVSPDSADLYLHHYINYRKSSQELFPHAPSRPNHHFAMHNAELMKFWGPLIHLSEFPYEQHNGTLQKIKTNSHLWEIDLTMLRQVCRRGRILSTLKDDIFLDCTEPTVASVLMSSQEMNSRTEDQSLMPDHHYSKWLHYLNSHPDFASQPFRHRTMIPHPDGTEVLPHWTTIKQHINHNTRTFSVYDCNKGNSSISWKDRDGKTSAGFIQSIWVHELRGLTRTYLLVAPHLRLSPHDAQMSPYLQYPGFMADIVYAQICPPSRHLIIEVNQIVGHVPFYARPRGTFGIKQATLVIINSLHRNRTVNV